MYVDNVISDTNSETSAVNYYSEARHITMQISTYVLEPEIALAKSN